MKIIFTLMLTVFILLPPGAAALEVGEEAPDFQALSTKGEIALKAYRGEKKVILAFYFADFTPV